MSFGNQAKQKSKSETSQSTSNKSTNINLQDTGDGTNIGVETIGSLTLVDPGSFELGRDAINSARDMLGSITDLARSVLGSNQDTLLRSFDFLDDSRSDTLDFASDSNRLVANSTRDALDFASERSADQLDLFGGVLGFVKDLQRDAQSMLGSTVTALNAIAVEQNKSTDQRVAEISGNATKYVLLAVVSLAVVGGAIAIFRRR